MSKNVMKILTLLMAVVMIAACFAACGGDTSSEEPATDEPAAEAEADTDAAADDAAAAGFTEIPIFEDEELGFINLSAVYFQPVPMSDGTKAEDYDIHLEADISALENNFGYELGSWIPYLTVDYKVEQNGEEKAAGTFMEMAASDGPHYGANIKLPEAGTYSLTITIHSPADNNYLLHTDELTGPGAKSFDEAFPDGVITYTYDSWDYLGPQSAE
ncbi:MAG: iron transporter [Firmicutes bacterium]|nr:iron transporter [Bacillota bacterium]MBR2577262.1 iron transporter [Bacillota bacterium]